MFKYTPKKSILRDMEVPKTPGTAWWDKEFYKRKEILKAHHADQGYMMQTVLQTEYHNVCHYSKTPLRQIPVRGYLFPVSMFNEEVVDNS